MKPMNTATLLRPKQEGDSKTTRPKPTFSIFLSNKRKKPGLCKSFLEEHSLSPTQTQIVLEDGSIWPLYHEHKVVFDNGYYKAIVSFQCFEDGSYYAVARPLKERNTNG